MHSSFSSDTNSVIIAVLVSWAPTHPLVWSKCPSSKRSSLSILSNIGPPCFFLSMHLFVTFEALISCYSYCCLFGYSFPYIYLFFPDWFLFYLHKSIWRSAQFISVLTPCYCSSWGLGTVRGHWAWGGPMREKESYILEKILVNWHGGETTESMDGGFCETSGTEDYWKWKYVSLCISKICCHYIYLLKKITGNITSYIKFLAHCLAFSE